jgi:hypothetical protein
LFALQALTNATNPTTSLVLSKLCT